LTLFRLLFTYKEIVFVQFKNKYFGENYTEIIAELGRTKLSEDI